MATDSQQSQNLSSDEILIDNAVEYEKYIIEENELQSKMVSTIVELTNLLITEHGSDITKVLTDPKIRRTTIQDKIEAVFADLLKQISDDEDPVLRIRDRVSWSNCIFGDKICLKTMENCTRREIKFCNKKSLPKFSLIFCVLGKIYKLLATGETCTKRELYYQNIEFITDQSLLDSALNDISCLLNCPLYDLNIYTTSNGLICGPLKIITAQNEIDCGLDEGATVTRGTLIPNDVSNIVDLKTGAKFVLLIEKDAVFQKLLDNGAMKKLPPCIFVTGKGMPDINTRALLKIIWDKLHIPILALVDADPWGIDIMCIYRYGSRALSHQADLLAVPSIRWLGPYPSEISKLCDRTSCLNVLDKSKLKDLLDRPYITVNKKIAFEIQFMLTTNCKAEIEDLEITVGYLSNMYLPHKIANGDFI